MARGKGKARQMQPALPTCSSILLRANRNITMTHPLRTFHLNFPDSTNSVATQRRIFTSQLNVSSQNKRICEELQLHVSLNVSWFSSPLPQEEDAQSLLSARSNVHHLSACCALGQPLPQQPGIAPLLCIPLCYGFIVFVPKT